MDGSAWQLVEGVFALRGEVFRQVAAQPGAWQLGLGITLLAGLSEGIGQCVVLFVNQVKPLRFAFSLIINAVLFAAGFLALVLSTWLIAKLLALPVSVGALVAVLGLSYGPLLFGFLGALPYLGSPLLALLAGWNLLAASVGVGAIAFSPASTLQGFTLVAIGWILLQGLQQTVGSPLAQLSRWLASTVAGVDLVTRQAELETAIEQRLQHTVEQLQHQIETFADVAAPAIPATVPATTLPNIVGGAGSSRRQRTATTTLTPTPVRGSQRTLNPWLLSLLGVLLIALLTGVVVVSLRPLQDWLFGWHAQISRPLRLTLDLVWIGVIALVVAGLLAPLETLGWYAGWYNDEVDTTVNSGELARPALDSDGFSRYVVYLDGIGKSTFEYLPDIEQFLRDLACTLPQNTALVRGIMPYSVVNNPLDEDRPLAFLWKLADQVRSDRPTSLFGLLVNLRNVLVVGVSADRRYGPLYNQGIAQVVYNGLIKNGYVPRSGTPITLIGYSGGAQMACACAPSLKRALSAPISVISLGGVISGNTNLLQLEHLYHLVGEKDTVERIGPIMFPGRWPLFVLSYWNRARRRGKITVVDMGPVGHQVPGGILDPQLTLPDGRSALQQTIDTVKAALQGNLLSEPSLDDIKFTNYFAYRQVPFLQPGHYPISQRLDPQLYQPIGEWMGRLMLPQKSQRQRVQGALLEVHHAPAEYGHLVGEQVFVRWSRDPRVQRLVKAVVRDVHFSADAEYSSDFGGLVLPERLDHWLQVDPLESLAGAHPVDDITVLLEAVEVGTAATGEPVLYISSHPVEISGRFYALIQFVEPTPGDCYRVRHFDRASRRFDGPEEIMATPPVIMAPDYGSFPSTPQGLETSLHNETGWYVYGAQNHSGQFVISAWLPRALLRLQPQRVVAGADAAYRYIRKEAWADVEQKKGTLSSVLCTPATDSAVQAAAESWQEGDQGLVLHVYGGIGGRRAEAAAKGPLYFGHFSYGRADVVRDPLSGDLRFDLRYHQVYTHNTDGLTAGTLHACRYLGNRQLGWLGNRPVCDIVVKLPCFTGRYQFEGDCRSPLWRMENFLQAMTARYRIGDGTGVTYVSFANNCSQDSNQALFAAIQQMNEAISASADSLAAWRQQHPQQAEQLGRLQAFGARLERRLRPIGHTRPDWETNEFNIGSALEDEPLRNLIMGLGSWRTLLPRKASDAVVEVFLEHGASAWVLRTNQVGGYDPTIAPVAPMTL